jgi:glutathionyl-hydroquinone reductase
MLKLTLTLGEIYTLDTELTGTINQQSGEKLTKGLLGQNISLLQKYWLTDLSEEVGKLKKTVDTLRNELVQKLGEPGENGTVSIPMAIDKRDENDLVVLNEENEPIKVLNPKFQEFNLEMEKLLSESREIESYPFKIEDFDFKTDENYSVFFKLVKSIKKAESSK